MKSASPRTKVAVTVPSVFFVAWIVMLAMGDLHLDVNRHIPNVGYLLTLVVCWAATLLVRLVRGR